MMLKANFAGYESFDSDTLPFTVTFRGTCEDAILTFDPNIFSSVNLPEPYKIGEAPRSISILPSMVTKQYASLVTCPEIKISFFYDTPTATRDPIDHSVFTYDEVAGTFTIYTSDATK